MNVYVLGSSKLSIAPDMGVRRRGQEGALVPLAGQNSMFFDFKKENSMF